jgi:peptidoglycan/LPS O-acetylase OafA/YrhL
MCLFGLLVAAGGDRTSLPHSNPGALSAWERVLFWGLPAALTLTASVAGEGGLGRLMPTLGIRIGEASYSLYLTVLGVALARSHIRGAALGGI